MADGRVSGIWETKHYTVGIHPGGLRGWFEHKTLGDESGGGLWMDPIGEVVDYDGVYELPKEVCAKLKELGFWGEML